MRNRILSLIAVTALATACSVKEDRTGCACLLVLDMSPCANAPDNIRIELKTLDERIEQNFIPGQDSPFYEYPVTKGSCVLSAFLCPRELSSGTEKIIIEEGENCPELYASLSVFEALGETAEHKVFLHKHFATVTLDLEESSWDSQSCDIRVEGGINGISLTDLKPTEGKFCYEAPVNGLGRRTFRLPRQTQGSVENLTLLLGAQGRSPQIFELGKYLSEAGYDWEMEDLQDVEVKVKESEIVIEILSSDWIIQSTEVIVI